MLSRLHVYSAILKKKKKMNIYSRQSVEKMAYGSVLLSLLGQNLRYVPKTHAKVRPTSLYK